MTDRQGAGFAGFDNLLARISALQGARVIVAVAGPPGAGKSTLVGALARGLNGQRPGTAAVIPMDGFHYDDAVLAEWDLLTRKGAPATFDAAGLASLLDRLRRNAEAFVAVPVFDRNLELSRGSARIVRSDIRILIVEGNYLLLDDPDWLTLRPFYDLTVLLREERETLKARLVARWLSFGFDREAAEAKAMINDLPNADLVLSGGTPPDVEITSEGQADMQFFADTAEISQIRTLAGLGLLDGVTTNPSLIVKSGRRMHEVITEICTVTDGPVSAEVVATDVEGMIAEGRELAALAQNVIVKVPLTDAGLAACRAFVALGIRVNVTLCFSVVQALVAAKSGATYISPFVGRLDDVNLDGLQLIRCIRLVYDRQRFSTQILAASIRSANHVSQAALAGADAITAPESVLRSLTRHPLTDAGLDRFMADWKATNH
jgi:transaldolase